MTFFLYLIQDGLENNESAIQAELANLREEILKLSLKQEEQMKEQQQILSAEITARKNLQSFLDAEITARNGQDKVLQSSIEAIYAKPK